jgi:hypothetical protein
MRDKDKVQLMCGINTKRFKPHGRSINSTLIGRKGVKEMKGTRT